MNTNEVTLKEYVDRLLGDHITQDAAQHAAMRAELAAAKTELRTEQNAFASGHLREHQRDRDDFLDSRDGMERLAAAVDELKEAMAKLTGARGVVVLLALLIGNFLVQFAVHYLSNH